MGLKARPRDVTQSLLALATRPRVPGARVSALLAAGADPNAVDPDDGLSALWQFALAGRGEAFRLCVDAGADLNQTVPDAGPAWLRAVKSCGDPTLLAHCLDRGADVAARWYDGDTILHELASRHAPNAMWHVALAAGADASAVGRRGETPLFLAMRLGPPEAVSRLLAAGADPGHRNADGVTALTAGVERGNAACVRRVASTGCTLASGKAFVREAYDLAVASGYRDIARALGGDAADQDLRAHPNTERASALRAEMRRRLEAGDRFETANREYGTSVRYRDGAFQVAEWETPAGGPSDTDWRRATFGRAVAVMTDWVRRYDGDDGDVALLERALDRVIAARRV